MSEETPRPIMLYVEGGMFIGKGIVFCKDCKYWEKQYDEYDGEEWWTCGKYEPYHSNDTMGENDFCSRGERR